MEPKLTHELVFMGTAAGCGVPSFFCDCVACEEARANPALAKGDCGIMVRRTCGDAQGAKSRTDASSLRTNSLDFKRVDFEAPLADPSLCSTMRPCACPPISFVDQSCPTLVIDTPPEARAQLLREGVRRVDEVLFTHCHYDHIGGLGEYEYMVALARRGEKLPVYGSEDALAGIFQEFHYMDYALEPHLLEAGDTHEFDGVTYTALPVLHAPGTYGYLIDTPASRTFYASDTGPLPAETAERIRGVDNLIMDATFWKKNWNPEDHHSIQECIEEGMALDAGKIFLTHTCMHYDEPITHAELAEYVSQYGGRVAIAMDGLKIPI